MDLGFSSSAPGGDREMRGGLLRGLEPSPDEGLFDRVRVYGPGGETVWLGLVQQLPRETGQGIRMSPQAVGFASLLDYDKTFREVYVDRDLGSWGEVPIERRADVLGSSISMGDMSMGTADGAIVCDLPNQALGTQTLTELWYRAPAGVKVSKVTALGSAFGIPSGWTLLMHATDSLQGTPSTSTGYSANGTLYTATLGTPRRYLLFQLYSNGTAATPVAGANVNLTRVAVYGDHGLGLYTTTGGMPFGVRASDVIADVVSRTTPWVSLTTGPAGSIKPTTLSIPHLTFPTNTTASDVIATVNKFHGWDWLVYAGPDGSPTLYFQPPRSGRSWVARRSDGAKLGLDGDSTDVILTAIQVAYDDGTGRQKLAGPPGSGCDVEDALLADSGAGNPARAWGYVKTDTLALSSPTSDEAAVVVGAIALQERNAATRRGRITVTGMIESTEGIRYPVSRVRAGDVVTIGDRPNDPERRIIAVDYDHPSRTATITVDNTPATLDAILERQNVATALLGI